MCKPITIAANASWTITIAIAAFITKDYPISWVWLVMSKVMVGTIIAMGCLLVAVSALKANFIILGFYCY